MIKKIKCFIIKKYNQFKYKKYSKRGKNFIY